MSAVVLTASAIAVTACSPAQTVSAGPAPTSAESSSATTSTTTTAAKPTATSQVVEDDQNVVHPCTADALGKAQFQSLEVQEKGEGYVYVVNTSGKPCLLQGSPTTITAQLTMMGAGSQRMQAHLIPDLTPAAAETVLQPDEWAGFNLSWRDNDVDCDTPVALLITPPGNEDPFGVDVNADGDTDMHMCDSNLHVSGWEKTTAP